MCSADTSQPGWARLTVAVDNQWITVQGKSFNNWNLWKFIIWKEFDEKKDKLKKIDKIMFYLNSGFLVPFLLQPPLFVSRVLRRHIPARLGTIDCGCWTSVDHSPGSSVIKLFNLMFASMALQFSDTPFYFNLLALLTNIILGWKGFFKKRLVFRKNTRRLFCETHEHYT